MLYIIPKSAKRTHKRSNRMCTDVFFLVFFFPKRKRHITYNFSIMYVMLTNNKYK